MKTLIVLLASGMRLIGQISESNEKMFSSGQAEVLLMERSAIIMITQQGIGLMPTYVFAKNVEGKGFGDVSIDLTQVLSIYDPNSEIESAYLQEITGIVTATPTQKSALKLVR